MSVITRGWLVSCWLRYYQIAKLQKPAGGATRVNPLKMTGRVVTVTLAIHFADNHVLPGQCAGKRSEGTGLAITQATRLSLEGIYNKDMGSYYNGVVSQLVIAVNRKR